MQNMERTYLVLSERSEIILYVEYLLSISIEQHKNIAKIINDMNLTSIRLDCLNDENININYTPFFLKEVNKDNITILATHILLDSEVLYEFHNLESLIYYNKINYKLKFDMFKNLKYLTVVDYDNNINITNSDNLIELYFFKDKKREFNYKIDDCKIEKVHFDRYAVINFNDINFPNLKTLSIFRTKNIIIDSENEMLKSIENLILDNCNISSIDSAILKKMSNLKELSLEKCDLTNFSNVWEYLPKLEKLMICDCKNLATLKGLHIKKRVVILGTKVQNCDLSPIRDCPEKEIPNHTYYKY